MFSDLHSCIVVAHGVMCTCVCKVNRCKKGWGLFYLNLTWTLLCCWFYTPPWVNETKNSTTVCVFDLHKFPMKTVDVYQLLRQLSGTINLREEKVHFVSRVWGFQPTIDGPIVPGPVVRSSTTERVWWSTSWKEGTKGKRKRPGSQSPLCLNNQETSHEALTSRVPNISPKHQPGDKAFNSWPFGGTSNRNIQWFTAKLKWPKFHFTRLQTAIPDFWKKKHWIWKMIFIYQYPCQWY